MHTRLSRIFNGLKVRCYNTKNKDYTLYGGRGIKLCDEWNNRETVRDIEGNNTKGFLAFKKWALENGYTDNLTVDRIDVNGDYSPENCKWVTQKEQCNNKRNNHYITYNGKTQSLAEWARDLGIKRSTLSNRLNVYGWSVEKAFNHP